MTENVDVYSQDKLLADDATNVISGGIIVDNLYLMRKNTTFIDAGAVRGAKGPAGAPGEVTAAQLSAVEALITPGAWQTGTLNAPNWINYPGTYPIFRYKKDGYRVFLDGFLQYKGSTQSSGSTQITAAANPLPVGYRPQYAIGLNAYRSGRYKADIRISTAGVITLSLYSTFPALVINEWVSLTGLSYPLP